MATLWLIRHGETDWNTKGRFQGFSDQPLNPNGEAQATSLAPRLKAMTFNAMFSSDLIRVQRTAKLALDGNIDHLVLDERLREFDFGDWEGLTWAEAREQHPDEFARWADDRNYNPHGGETVDDVVNRVTEFINEIRGQYTHDEHILIFAHGGTLAVLVCILLGNDPNRWWQYRFLNCSLSEVILVNRGAILTRLNDLAHLPDIV